MIRLDLDDSCLFLDIDGTLLDIASKPHDVIVPDALVQQLGLLSHRLDGALALVSGRSVADIDSLFGDFRPRASGAHGGELRVLPGGAVTRVGGGALPDALREELAELAQANKGVMVEDKDVCIAIHYREVPTLGEALHVALQSILDAYGDPALGILPGRLVYEVKRLANDKGTAVDAFMAQRPFVGRTPFFFGDDVTDQAGFAAAQRHGGNAYSVGRDYPGVVKGFETPAEVREWIEDITRDLSRG